jgi:two-component system cell cycle response regulator
MKMFDKWRKAPATGKNHPFTEAEAAPATKGEDLIGQDRKILVVDDNEVVLKAFELKFSALGFKVCKATDGAAAVSVARHEKPDVIVLDINFPPEVGSSGLQWDGFSIMQWLQRFKEVADIPVIIITSGDPEKLKARAMAAGAVAFFQKPINHEELLMSVRRSLRAKPQAA